MSFIRLKYLLKLREGNTESNSTVLVLSSGSLKIKSDLTFGRNPLTYRYHQQVLKGDFVICLRDLDGVLLYGLSNYSGCISNLYYVFQIIQGNPLYFYYYISYLDIQNLFFQLSSGMRYTLSLYHFLNIKVAFPSLDKQQQVSIFLNQKSHLIQELLLKIDLLLKKLEEYQEALLYETLMIQKNQKNFLKLKYFLTVIERGFQAPQNLLVEKDSLSKDCSYLPWFNIGDLTNSYLFESQKYLLKDNIPLTKIYPPNSLLIAVDGATIGKLGISTTPFVMNSHCCVLSCNDSLEMKYLYYYFLLLNHLNYFSKISHGSIFQGITIENLKSIKFPFCSLSHQEEVISLLDSQIHLLKELQHHYTSLKVHLEEYQQSLIYETFQHLL